MRKFILSLLLCFSVTAVAQIPLSGPVVSTSPGFSPDGAISVALTSGATCDMQNPSSNCTLTATGNASYTPYFRTIVITGSLTANTTLLPGARSAGTTIWVTNNSTGGYGPIVSTGNGGTTYTVPPNAKAVPINTPDGTNWYAGSAASTVPGTSGQAIVNSGGAFGAVPLVGVGGGGILAAPATPLVTGNSLIAGTSNGVADSGRQPVAVGTVGYFLIANNAAAPAPAYTATAPSSLICLGSGTSHAPGLVPDPGATAGTSRFLREDCTFAAPTGSGTVNTGNTNQLAYYPANGTAVSPTSAIPSGTTGTAGQTGNTVATNTDIASEATARATAVTNETTRATAAEGTNATNITNEVTARTTAIAGLPSVYAPLAAVARPGANFRVLAAVQPLLGQKNPVSTITPTLSYNTASIIPNATYFPAFNTGTGAVDFQHFNHIGSDPIQAGAASPFTDETVNQAYIGSDTNQEIIEYEVNSSNVEIRIPQVASPIRIWSDGVLLGDFVYNATGAAKLAQATTSTSITLNATGVSGADGFYTNQYVNIVSGLGAGQQRQIANFTGASKLATLKTPWTITPDTTTSMYTITFSTATLSSGTAVLGSGFSCCNNTPAYLDLNFGVYGKHIIREELSMPFAGVNVDSSGTVTATPSQAVTSLVGLGDSYCQGYQPSGASQNYASYFAVLAKNLGLVPWNFCENSTGFLAGGGSSSLTSYAERIAPPVNSWVIDRRYTTGTTGTFSITQGGNTATVTQNTNVATIQSAIDSAFGAGAFKATLVYGSTGSANTLPITLIGQGSNATVTTPLTATTTVTGSINVYQWTGLLAPEVPLGSSPTNPNSLKSDFTGTVTAGSNVITGVVNANTQLTGTSGIVAGQLLECFGLKPLTYVTSTTSNTITFTSANTPQFTFTETCHSGTPQPFLINVQGSINDNSSTGLQAAVSSLLTNLYTNYPTAAVLMEGRPMTTGPQSAPVATETALEAAAAATLVPVNGVFPFLPLFNNAPVAVGPYASGAGYIQGTTNIQTATGASGNNSDALMAIDQLHPIIPAGANYLAAQYTNFFQRVLTQ